MFVVESVRRRYIDVVPAVISSLVATDQQNRTAARVKGVKRSIGVTFVLCPEFTHVAVLGTVDSAAMRETQIRPTFFEQLH